MFNIAFTKRSFQTALWYMNGVRKVRACVFVGGGGGGGEEG